MANPHGRCAHTVVGQARPCHHPGVCRRLQEHAREEAPPVRDAKLFTSHGMMDYVPLVWYQPFPAGGRVAQVKKMLLLSTGPSSPSIATRSRPRPMERPRSTTSISSGVSQRLSLPSAFSSCRGATCAKASPFGTPSRVAIIHRSGGCPLVFTVCRTDNRDDMLTSGLAVAIADPTARASAAFCGSKPRWWSSSWARPGTR